MKLSFRKAFDIEVFGLFLNVFQYFLSYVWSQIAQINLFLHFAVFSVIGLERLSHPSITLEKNTLNMILIYKQ